MVTINELAKSVGFTGQPNHKIAEPGQIRTLPIVDNSVPTRKNVTTSVDCYVSGQYVQKNGAIIEVTQRYTIFVSYSKDTQRQTMQQVNTRIVGDFEARYGGTFNVSTVFVPDLPIPIEDKAEPLELYGGTDMFRQMSRFEKMRTDIYQERLKERTNIRSIKSRYGYR